MHVLALSSPEAKLLITSETVYTYAFAIWKASSSTVSIDLWSVFGAFTCVLLFCVNVNPLPGLVLAF